MNNRSLLDTAIVLSEIKNHDDFSNFKKFYKKCRLKSVLCFTIDWLIIFLSVLIVHHFSIVFIPLAIVFIGARQRALSNLIHESSHYNLFSNNNLGDLIANWFAAYPMFDSVENYRKHHFRHHKFLGQKKNDPDYESHLRYGFDDYNPHREKFLSRFATIAFNKCSIRDSFFGSVTMLNAKEILKIIFWFVAIWFLITIFTSYLFSNLFIAMWFMSKLTSYHFIRLSAEFLDHSGLRPDCGTIRYTRNIPGAGILKIFFHPHQDNYHLIHHLLPSIAHYNLPKVHRFLLSTETYKKTAHHCSGYITGEHSAIDCWLGNCRIGSNQ